MTDNGHLELDPFRAAARNFIQTVDSVASIEREPFIARLSHCLIELYSSALDLPAVEPDTASIDETPFDPEKWTQLCNTLRDKIAPFDAYWRIFDSTKNEPPVQGTLAGDISEIYFDLAHDLHIQQKGITHADYLWSYGFPFGPTGESTYWELSSQCTTVMSNKAMNSLSHSSEVA
jgi:hypothetical protein